MKDWYKELNKNSLQPDASSGYQLNNKTKRYGQFRHLTNPV